MSRIEGATHAALSNKPATCRVDALAVSGYGGELKCAAPDNGHRRNGRPAMWQIVAPAWRRKRALAGRSQMQFWAKGLLGRR